MNYYRKPINKVVNDVKLKMQLGALTLKLNENNNKINDLIGVKKDVSSNSDLIDTNTSNISSNLEKINDNENSISNNLKNIDNVNKFISKSEKYFEKKYFIQKQVFKFNKENNFFTIFEEEIEYDFIKNTLLFVQNNIYYNYEDLSDDYHRAQHEYKIYDDENNLIHKYLFNKDTYYVESLDPILYTNEDFCICLKKNYKKIKINLQLHRHNRHGYGSFNMEIDEINDNYINITCTDDQKAADISDNSTLIETNTSNISSNLGKINTNTSNISDNLGKINTNTSSISTNLEKINKINELNKNIKAFYNLDQIFIYDIENGYQSVNKDNHYHIFEKEIIYNFIKNSYLEIALKVLTEISNYVLIGFFQILCNFYDQDNNLFYTISLSTAMGSINKLSTIKSVFIVPINEHMSKIKIDFFIAPKKTQQNRSATFTIKDINSNKIHIKYFQKTEEMSIKDIQDSLNSVKNINLEQIDKNKNDITDNLGKINNITKTIMLKNTYFTDFNSTDETIYNELLRLDGASKKIVNMFNLDMGYDFKKDDFIEIDCKIILNHNSYDDAKNLALYFELYEGIKALQNKLIFRESRRYNQFPIVLNKDRIIVYTKLCYKVKYDIINIKFRIQLQSLYAKTVLILNHEIIPNGSNYIFIKHYGN